MVPETFRTLSSARVLTMSLEAGVPLHSAAAVRAAGVSPAAAAALVWETYFAMLLTTGLAHCDPHAANWLVRPLPGGGGRGALQLVILDHGLYDEVHCRSVLSCRRGGGRRSRS